MFLGFWALFLGTIAVAGTGSLRARDRVSWTLDLMGLLVQGTLVPLAQAGLVAGALSMVFPSGRGSLELPPLWSFLVCFVGVDLLYYWNHRWLHTAGAWRLHRAHHTATAMDVLPTSRNALWTSAFIVYLWCGGLFLWWLADPWPYAAAATLTALLDLWRHSPLDLPDPASDVLEWVFVTPRLHARHHGAEIVDRNFAANLSLWDRAFGTFDGGPRPDRLGVPDHSPGWRQLLWPTA